LASTPTFKYSGVPLAPLCGKPQSRLERKKMKRQQKKKEKRRKEWQIATLEDLLEASYNGRKGPAWAQMKKQKRAQEETEEDQKMNMSGYGWLL
jgi:hypothetical protein